jgi:ubiquinol-cytochrome c reductase iron-sulfur subunit
MRNATVCGVTSRNFGIM